VWSEDESGHTELIDTTKSLAEAKNIANKALEDGFYVVAIYRELNGELELVEELES